MDCEQCHQQIQSAAETAQNAASSAQRSARVVADYDDRLHKLERLLEGNGQASYGKVRDDVRRHEQILMAEGQVNMLQSLKEKMDALCLSLDKERRAGWERYAFYVMAALMVLQVLADFLGPLLGRGG